MPRPHMIYFFFVSFFLSIPCILVNAPLATATAADSDGYMEKARNALAALIQRDFERHVRDKLVEEGLEKYVNEHVHAEHPPIEEAALKAERELASLFEKRVAVLRELTGVAETALSRYRPSFSSVQLLDDAELCARVSKAMNKVNVSGRFDPEEAGQDMEGVRANSTGVHFALEAYRCDESVIRDFEWTGQDDIQRTMIAAKAAHPSLAHLYIGTYHGITRMYPSRKWVIEPEEISIDLFQPQFRPWFVAAESPPMDILFLVDFSGSMKGQSSHLTKMTMLHVLAIMGPQHNFAGVWFNSQFGNIFPCKDFYFYPATTRNKIIFRDQLEKMEEREQANIGPALDYSFTMLRNSSITRPGSQRILMLFTDGIDDFPYALCQRHLSKNDSEPIRVAAFSMGFGVGRLSELDWLTCATGGTQRVVDSVSDVRHQARAHIELSNHAYATHLSKMHVKQRPIAWTTSYMDTQAGGQTVSLAMPIVDRTVVQRSLDEDSASNWTLTREQLNPFGGIAAVDVRLSEVRALLDVTEPHYAFVIDNNGIVLYHPEQVLPKREVYSIRRSACYRANTPWSRSRAAASLRVQFGWADDRAHRLLGLSDSIATQHIATMEPNTETFTSFWQGMLRRECSNKPVVDGDRQYVCRPIANTPFVVAVVGYSSRRPIPAATPFSVSPSMLSALTSSPLVHLSLSPTARCADAQEPLGAADPTGNLLTEDATSLGCGTPALVSRLAASLSSWIDGWDRDRTTETMSENETYTCGHSVPRHFSPHFGASFVHTFTHLTAVFPACRYKLARPFSRRLEATRWNRTEGQLEIRVDPITGNMAVIRPIAHPDLPFRSAEAGVVYNPSYLNGLLSEWSSSNAELSMCRQQQRDCLVLSDSGWLLGRVGGPSKYRFPVHLFDFDPSLFNALRAQRVIRTWSLVEHEAECVARGTSIHAGTGPLAAAASRARSLIQSLLRLPALLLSRLPVHLWVHDLLGFDADAQPAMHGQSCVFHPVDKMDRCSQRLHFARVESGTTNVISFGSDMRCNRTVRMLSLPGTKIRLVIATTPCVNWKPSAAQHEHFSSRPERLSDCAFLSNYYRQPRKELLSSAPLHPNDNYATCDLSSSSAHSRHRLLLLVTSCTSLLTLMISWNYGFH